jgi:hypothetical protein
MPSEPLAMYNRRSTYLIQVRETRAPLATFPRVLTAASNTLPPELRSDPNAFEKGDRPSIAAVGVFPDGNLCKTQGYAVSRFRNKAQRFSLAKQLTC